MSKLLSLKDYILIFAAYSADSLQEFRNLGNLVPNLMQARYGFVPPNFKKKSYRSVVSRLLSAGQIEKKVGLDGKVYLEITPGGKNKISRKFQVFNLGKWDGSFMIVIFDIPEKEKRARQDLRNKLKELGFGMLQESVWVSPNHYEDDLNEFLEAKNYTGYVYVLRARKILGKSIRDSARDIWKLKDINFAYQRVVDLVEKDSEGNISKAWKIYLSALSVDPILPRELLSADWNREKAFEILKKNTRSKMS